MIPEYFRLVQNLPNPFNVHTRIQFDLPVRCFVELRVFDLLVKEVETLVEAEREPGVYEIIWDETDISSGIYLCRLKAGDFVETKKWIVKK